MEFLNVPDSYYDMLKRRLATSDTKIVENLDTLQVLLSIADSIFWATNSQLHHFNHITETEDTNRLRRKWLSPTDIYEKYAGSPDAVYRSYTETKS